LIEKEEEEGTRARENTLITDLVAVEAAVEAAVKRT